MAKHEKKNSWQEVLIAIIVFLTAILNLVDSILDLLERLFK